MPVVAWFAKHLVPCLPTLPSRLSEVKLQSFTHNKLFLWFKQPTEWANLQPAHQVLNRAEEYNLILASCLQTEEKQQFLASDLKNDIIYVYSDWMLVCPVQHKLKTRKPCDMGCEV